MKGFSQATISAEAKAQVAAEADDALRLDQCIARALTGERVQRHGMSDTPPPADGTLALVDVGTDNQPGESSRPAYWRGGQWVDEWGDAIEPTPSHWAQFLPELRLPQADDPERSKAYIERCLNNEQFLRRPMRTASPTQGTLALVDRGTDDVQGFTVAAFWRVGQWVDERGVPLKPAPTHWGQFVADVGVG